MPHDLARVEDTRAWLLKAQLDLRAAEHVLIASPPLLEDVVFHCQQAIEKAMKGFLAWHDNPFRKTHDLEEIGEACVALDPSLKPIVDLVVPLTEYAWKYRYPGDILDMTAEEASEAVAVAHKGVEAIFARLPEETRPGK